MVGPGTEYQSTSSPPGQLALLVPVSRISPTPDGGSLRGSGGRRVMHGRWVGVEWWTWKGVYSRMQSQSQELGIGEFGQILPDCKRCWDLNLMWRGKGFSLCFWSLCFCLCAWTRLILISPSIPTSPRASKACPDRHLLWSIGMMRQWCRRFSNASGRQHWVQGRLCCLSNKFGLFTIRLAGYSTERRGKNRWQKGDHSLKRPDVRQQNHFFCQTSLLGASRDRACASIPLRRAGGLSMFSGAKRQLVQLALLQVMLCRP